ncbi:MAG: hypothetical protein ACKV19_16795 [Verrucomicrobiales bacterium]
MGKIEVRFPTIGIEREFQQRESRITEGKGAAPSRGERISRVLEANGHLATRVCYLFSAGSVPLYIVVPSGGHLRPDLLRAISLSGTGDYWTVLIGRRGAVAPPSLCGGILAPLVACDQLYSFSMDDWIESLEMRLRPALKSRQVEAKNFKQVARELFDRVVSSTENLGASDAHRALNYLIMQHAGLFLAALERSGKQVLDKIETRELHGIGTRHLVAVIFTFLDVVTGIPERLFCRVDVTEEWPFIADSNEGVRNALGLAPFVENSSWGMPF